MKNATTPATATSATWKSLASSRTIRIAAAVAATLGLSACGAVAEKATEQGVERLIESSLDDELDGFDIDIDLSDGDFSINTDDGGLSFSEDGSIVFDTGDGTFTGQVDETGIEMIGDDGSIVDIGLDGNGDSASISVETPDGSFEASSELATLDDWPAEVPRPILEADEWFAGSVTGDQVWLMAGGSISATPQEAVAAYASLFSGADIVEEDWGDSEAVTITTDAHSINIIADVNALRGGSSVSYTVSSR